ncbi:DUF1549 domain-containing protein, partial [Stieleria sp.]|uniref:DUF1549 domain-containing protein n=1 Tax=Stieleria sp. TaxID=2795976 RepID=UPI0035655CE1
MMNPLTRVLLTLVIALPVVAAGEERVDFNRDIRPILSENCLLCHGPDESSREADLRLDSYDGATDSGVIVPGESDESEFVRRILSDSPDEIMPPPDSDKQLSPADIGLLRRWIDQGAEYQQHWAWRSLERPEVSASADGTGVSKQGRAAAAIDALLASGWAEYGAAPVSMASPRERLRRLSFDLRGLPPTAAEVAKFEQDPSEQHFVEYRDRWMSQLAYAEHQAVRWLDLVRWADTSGFVSDEPIASGAYRAWVIKAFDQNMP